MTSNTPLRDRTGKIYGYRQQQGDRTLYYDAGGRLIARVEGGRTYDSSGKYIGQGDQALLLFP